MQFQIMNHPICRLGLRYDISNLILKTTFTLLTLYNLSSHSWELIKDS